LKIIITGAGGFLGNSLLQSFEAQGHEVLPMSFRPHNSDTFLNDFASALPDFSPDAVINAGASQNTKDSPEALAELIESNVTIPASMCALLKKHQSSAVFMTFGTSWQFGEDGSPQPFNAYASSKAALANFLDHFAQDGLRSATLVLYDTYGSNDPRNKIANLILNAGRTLQPLKMSEGNQAMDLVHIDDVVAAVAHTVGLLLEEQHGCHWTFGVRSGETTSPRNIAATIVDLFPDASMALYEFGFYSYRPRERFSLPPHLPLPPGWQPKIAPTEGLRSLARSVVHSEKALL
jgi:nucleoside-diphosphate-sugar epimerase